MISVWCSGASGETERDERGGWLEGEGIHCDPCIVNSSSVPGRDRDRERRGERDVVQEDWRRIYSRAKRYVLAWTGQLFSQSPSYLRTRTSGHCHNYLNAILTHTFPFPSPSTFLHSLRPSPRLRHRIYIRCSVRSRPKDCRTRTSTYLFDLYRHRHRRARVKRRQ